jgi:hypothetical protein
LRLASGVRRRVMKYECEQCQKVVDDNGPYERSDGEYQCQECMERSEMSLEIASDLAMEMEMERRQLDENN